MKDLVVVTGENVGFLNKNIKIHLPLGGESLRERMYGQY